VVVAVVVVVYIHNAVKSKASMAFGVAEGPAGQGLGETACMHIHTYTYIHTLRAFNELVAHLYSTFLYVFGT
jgi:hypothetical protein